MVYSAAALDATFGALADPTRREILARLTLGNPTISELASRFDMSLPAVSKHIGVLQRAGLARVARDGRVRRATLRAAPLRAADAWIERYRRYWESELDLLAKYLESPPPPTPESSWPPAPRRSQPSKSAARSARRGSASSTRGRKPKR
ncbi:MAG: ArsR/SmtB family transcription factor [Gemmatimonadaceae bacterium]